MSKSANLATLVTSAAQAGRPLVARNRELWLREPLHVPSGMTLSHQGSLLQSAMGTRAVLTLGVGGSWPRK